jgi:hypothetical protein
METYDNVGASAPDVLIATTPASTKGRPARASQRSMERAMRAARKSGLAPTGAEFHPDGRIVLWFGETKVGAANALDAEMDQWRRTNAAR